MRPLIAVCLLAISIFPALGKPDPKGDLTFLPFESYVSGLSPTEAQRMRGIFEEYQVIDLEKSGLHSWRAWLDEVNARLTKAAAKQGDQSPSYRIELLASNEPNAFVAKFRTAGSGFYRGHVFVTTGLIEHMAQNLGGSLTELSAEDYQRVLDGITGVIAHEFAHPKQDELIKWQWRGAHDFSPYRHGQVDEATTDNLALRLLKDAEFSPTHMLTGLELLFGDRPMTGYREKRIVHAGGSTHPQDQFRINLIRGALTQLRLQEGSHRQSPTAVTGAALQAESKRIRSGTTVRAMERQRRLFGVKKGASEFERTVEALRINLQKSKNLFEYLEIQKSLNEIVAEGYNLTPRDIEVYREVSGLILSRGASLAGDHPYPLSELAGDAHPEKEITMMNSHRRIRLFRKIRYVISQRPAVLSHHLAEAFWKSVEATKEASSVLKFVDHAGLFLDDENLEKLRASALGKITATLDPVSQFELHLRLWNAAILYDLPARIDSEAWNALRALTQTQKLDKRFSLFTERLIYGNKPLLILQERVKKDPAFLDRFMALAKENSRLPKTFASTAGADLYAYWVTDTHSRVAMFTWNADRSAGTPYRDIKDKPFIRAYYDRVLADFESAPWQKALQGPMNADPDLPTYQKDFEFTRHYREAWISWMNEAPESVGIPMARKLFGLIKSPDLRFRFIRTDLTSTWARSFRFQLAAETFDELLTSGKANVFTDELLKFGHSDRIRLLDILKKSGRTTEAHHKLFNTLTLANPAHNLGIELRTLEPFALQKLWGDFQQAPGGKVGGFLFHVLESHQLSRTSSRNTSQPEAEVAIARGLKFHPGYSIPLAHLHGNLAAEFLRVVGTTTKRESLRGDPNYPALFLKNYDSAKSYLTVIFNPDGVWLPQESKGAFPHHEMDRLTATFLPLIPAKELTGKQTFELWNLLTAKRPNRMTDAFYEEHILPLWEKLLEPSRTAIAQEILNRAQIRSERLTIQLTRHLLEQHLGTLELSRGSVSDESLRGLVDELQRYNSGGSRFKDSFLEDIAWRLQLSERQTLTLIEPMKTSNKLSMDPRIFNVLSSLTVGLEFLSVQERFLLLQHIQEPADNLTKAVPSLRRLADKTGKMSSKAPEVDVLFDTLDTFIRDANETERLILSELLVGTQGQGLWHRGPEARQRLYQLAGLSENNEKRALFEAYLKVIPKHEQSLTLSYLIATRSPHSSGELLRTLEVFGAPGIKFAQIASILQTFGPEKSAELKAAKDRAAPPTRAEIFKLLRERLTPTEYTQVKNVRKLLGSGSIKFVVSVEFTDGRSEAVYLRRPHLNERIDETLDLAERWMTHLRANPEYSSKYDYDYYLETLRRQLTEEVNFSREAAVSQRMDQLYLKVAPSKGWRFGAVPASKTSRATSDVLYYTEIENSVPFDRLSEAQKKEVGPYLLKTELNLLLSGEFDADRHNGNYLIDPVKKVIYPLDKAQGYRLVKNTLTKPGDTYRIAKIFHALGMHDTQKGALQLARTFASMHEGPAVSETAVQALAKDLEKAITPSLEMNQKLPRILELLNSHRIRPPLRVSLGVMKDLMILLNEEYAAYAPPELRDQILKSFVRRQLILGARFDLFDKLEDFMPSLGECRELLR